MLELIRALHAWGGPMDITINDFGLLHAINRESLTTSLRYYIGHIYSTSFENCPWAAKVLSEESDFIRESWCQNNFTNDALLEHMRERGIVGVEIEMLPIMLNKSAPYLKQHGMRIKGLIDYIPASVTRACHTARYNGMQPSPGCAHLCDTAINARFTHRYDPENQKTPWLPIDEELIRPWTPDYLLMGNMIFVQRQVELSKDNVNSLDEIAFDVRPFSWERLQQRIDAVREIAAHPPSLTEVE